ncbi:MAG: HpcH/HpaI aldolase/citrate lyase family protein [Thermodesulfobacteriota bacterium]
MAMLIRSMLYVPANSWRMINNCLNEGADAVILDLEDGCPMGEKETARVFARDAMPIIREQGLHVFVRVNSLDTRMTAQDLAYVVTQGLEGIVLPKTETAEEIRTLDAMLAKREEAKGLEEGQTAIMALIESPLGVLNVREIIGASPRVIGVAFGAGDYSREMGAGMGVTRVPPEEYFTMTLAARSALAMAARASGIHAIDTPFFGLVIDMDGLVRESGKVKLLGFSGKQLTHPRHVAPVNEVFSPAAEDVELARQVVAAYAEAQAKGLGATSVGGRMIDYGSFKRAKALLGLDEAIRARESRGAEG